MSGPRRIVYLRFLILPYTKLKYFEEKLSNQNLFREKNLIVAANNMTHLKSLSPSAFIFSNTANYEKITKKRLL